MSRASSPRPDVPDPVGLTLLRRHLLEHAVAALGDPDEAEDACQETLLRVWLSLRKGRLRDAPWKGYGFGVLRNVLRESLRRRGRPAPTLHPGVPSSDPLDEAERRERLGRVEEAFGRLSPEHRQVLTLAVFRGLPSAEISRRTGVPAATVRKRKHRALSRLRDLVERAGDGEMS
jgi:RNA polymerase sigma factor (sigma-70 family)